MLKHPRRALFLWCREHNECPFNGVFCDRKSCSWTDFRGQVKVCSEQGNPRGLFTRKRRISH
jgi:hypothetical protein